MSMRGSVRLGLLTFALGATACKPPAKSSGAGGDAGSVPRRISGGEGDATAPKSLGKLQVGGSNVLTMDLGRPPPSGSPNLWACYDPLAGDFELGRAICVDDVTKAVAITAANVEFTCHQNTEFGVIRIKSPLVLDGCPTVEVFAHLFDPPLTLAIRPGT